MDRTTTLSIVAALSVINGVFSPYVLLVASVWPVWYPGLVLPVTETILSYLTSLVTATLLFLASGIPAALVERMSGRPESGLAHGVWIGTIALLSLPTLTTLAAL